MNTESSESDTKKRKAIDSWNFCGN